MCILVTFQERGHFVMVFMKCMDIYGHISLGNVHTTQKKYENVALFISTVRRLPSTLIRHGNALQTEEI